ncbi:hypothetical protein LLE49_27835 [Alicyclobacillus tolerans]|uniref:hypothetical protein n=1 Tax=Alicyclobacillus tolerans TaxID=90970 RepID=UPI001F471C9A|nr:hypothetical protein [Alicyclobacillus tolerans]MCF8568534.1 hypothetical protein [Alicyclobacillus tolerans]
MSIDVTFDCPVCERRIQTQSIVMTSPDCRARFTSHPAAGGGVVVDCETSEVDVDKATHSSLMGTRLFLVISDRVQPEWLVKERHGGVVNLEMFLRRPAELSHITHTMKV